jgi:hypothetical protein
MFTIDPKITGLNVKEKSVLKILFSINTHRVANPETVLEEARSYVLFFREGRGNVSSYIAIHLLASDRKLYYSETSNPFPEEELGVVEDDARGFAEGLGAMLDEIDFTTLSVSDQERWINDQEIFSKKPSPEAQPAAQPAGPAPAQPVATVVPGPQQEAPKSRKAPAAVPRPADRSGAPSKPAPLAEAAKQQEIMQQAIKAGVAKPPKPAQAREAQSVTGAISRDREALARLLASF